MNSDTKRPDSEEAVEESPKSGEHVQVPTMQAAEHCLQAVAEQAEDITGDRRVAANGGLVDAQRLAMGPGVQALWQAVLPLIGARASRAGEFPGVFKVEAGEEDDEAIVYLDVPVDAYDGGERGDMDRVLALRVTLGHDYRRLGDHYYCIDCEAPTEETRH
jgi:hypothetical protein